MQYKYDRPAIKLEFFESDFEEVQPFFLQIYNKDTAKNKQIAVATKGRAKEKQEWKEKIVEKALAKRQSQLAKKMEISVDELLQAKRDIVDLLKVKLEEYFNDLDENGKSKINVKDLKTLREMTKTELWEPTTIQKNENNTQLSWDWPLVQIIRADINQKK